MSVCCGRAQSVCELIARVKVIGDGSDICKEQFNNCSAAIESLGMNIALDEINDPSKMAEFGASSVPVIVVGSKKISEGRLIPSDELTGMLRKAIFGI